MNKRVVFVFVGILMIIGMGVYAQTLIQGTKHSSGQVWIYINNNEMTLQSALGDFSNSAQIKNLPDNPTTDSRSYLSASSKDHLSTEITVIGIDNELLTLQQAIDQKKLCPYVEYLRSEGYKINVIETSRTDAEGTPGCEGGDYFVYYDCSNSYRAEVEGCTEDTHFVNEAKAQCCSADNGAIDPTDGLCYKRIVKNHTSPSSDTPSTLIGSFGHKSSEIMLDVSGTQKTLQRAINDLDLCKKLDPPVEDQNDPYKAYECGTYLLNGLQTTYYCPYPYSRCCEDGDDTRKPICSGGNLIGPKVVCR